MGFYRLILTLVVATSLTASQKKFYHLAKGRIGKALELYQKEKAFDPEFLEDLSMYLLKAGIASDEMSDQLLALYGASFGSPKNSILLCDQAMRYGSPMTQIATIHLLGQLQEDGCEELLTRAFNSPHLQIRFEAGYQLALRRSKQATGLFLSLMNHLPAEFAYYFPNLFALVGTKDALSELKNLMSNRNRLVKTAAIMAAAQHGRDDFLPQIRTFLTHKEPMEREAAIVALGHFGDLASKEAIEGLTKDPNPMIRLASYKALTLMGDHSHLDDVKQMALKESLFAINMLAELPTSGDVLAKLLHRADKMVRINAALALLSQRDARALPILTEMLIPNTHDLGLYPASSPGGTMNAWKIISSKGAFDSIHNTNISAITLSFREHVLTEAAQLSEPTFLHLAKEIFEQKQQDLIPTAVQLVESVGTEGAISLLKSFSTPTTTPLLREYCRLALFRLGKGPIEPLITRVRSSRDVPLIQFRPLLSWTEKQTDSTYTLTPETQSRLYIETLMAIANHHSQEGVNLIIELIASGDIHNRYALAGLLLFAIQ